MMVHEFDGWLKDLVVAFPSTHAWLNSLKNPEETLGVWRAALSDVEPDDASEVLRQMARGDIEPPAAYDRERTAAIVRKHCRLMAYERRQMETTEAHRAGETTRGRCQPIGPLIKRAMALGARLRAGEITKAQHDAEMEEIKRIAGSDPNAPEPRYRCPTCLECGSVVVWCPFIVREVRRTGRRPSRRRVCVVACTCSFGNALASPPERPGYKPRKLPLYDEAIHCRVRHGSPSDADVEELMEWVLGKEESGRHAEFDDWNAGV